MNNEQVKTTWKDYVFSWPTYIIMGFCLMELARRTEFYQKLEDKIFKSNN